MFELMASFLAIAAGAGSTGSSANLDLLGAEPIAAHVRTLASDRFAGRLPGTEGGRLTVAYIREHFESLQLTPPIDGGYLQRVPLFGTRPSAPPGWSLDAEVELEYGRDFVLGSKQDRRQVVIDASEIVFVGHGIVAEAYAWDDLKGLDLAGKTVLYLWGDPGSWGGDPELFAGRAMSRHGMGFAKSQVLAARGAAAIVAIHQPERAGYPFSVVSDGGIKWTYEIDDPAIRAAQPAASGIISYAAAQRLLEAAGEDLDALVEQANHREFRAVSTGIAGRMTLDLEQRRLASHNVAGMVAGGSRADEFIIYTAHWDHVGTRDEGPDRVFNGALDNATGTAMLLQLAAAFAALPAPPDKSVLFLATTAEEQGLLGAHYFVRNPLMPLARIHAVINMDASFPFGSFRGMTVPGLGNSELEDYLAQAAREVDRVLQPDPNPEMGAFFRSDHYPFLERGVPAIFAVGGPTQAQIEADTAMLERFMDYMHNGYHKVADEYDPATWDMRGIVEDAHTYFRTGLAIATDPRRPNWYLDSEFRALRDAQFD